MGSWFACIWPRRLRYRFAEEPSQPTIQFARSAYDGLFTCLAPALKMRHEGVALLLGRTVGSKVAVLQAVRPDAVTTSGSFHIPAREMARVIGIAMDLDLEVVGQVHTHPFEAYHSAGDEEGANIRYDGFVSIVIPEYGRWLPGREGWAIYRFSDAQGWVPLSDDSIFIIEGSDER